jgi:hypothetical protein
MTLIVLLFIVIIIPPPRYSSTAQHRLWPPCLQGFLITHNDAPHLVGLFWMSDQLVAETSP